MTYIYDLILNFNKKLYEFYEWEKSDKYYHIKKINLLKVNSKTYNDILDNKVEFNDEFFLGIFNKCEYYDKKDIKTIPYAFLLTDSYRVMGLILNDELKTINYSSLLLDEEEEVIEISSRLPLIELKYNILEKNIVSDLTRKEKKILNYIEKELNSAYKNKEFNKLKYLYYEYFNEESNDFDYMYNELLRTLNYFNNKHYSLYNLIKLSYNI